MRQILAAVVQSPEPTFVTVLSQLADIRENVRLLEYHVVALMREHGLSWTAIGDELGISRQAARRRFGAPRHRH